jgi:ABC-type Na+ efflux pump permease subunit
MRRRSKKRKLVIVTLVVLILLATIGVKVVASRLAQPTSGTIKVSAGSTTTNAPSLNLTPKHISGTYASFNYPAGLTTVRNDPLAAPVLEEFNFTHHDIESWDLTITILTNPGGSIASLNAYQFRKTQPSIYKESQQIFNGQSVDIMTDTSVGGFSKIAFLEGNGLAATVSLSGDDTAGLGALSTTFNMILGSWHWQ